MGLQGSDTPDRALKTLSSYPVFLFDYIQFQKPNLCLAYRTLVNVMVHCSPSLSPVTGGACGLPAMG